jgi:hypothetical protein
MVPIARLKFYCPELETNRPDDRDGRPYHDLGLPVLWGHGRAYAPAADDAESQFSIFKFIIRKS